ncbi:MAG: DUF6065 family protein [Pirellulaceae bacterium]
MSGQCPVFAGTVNPGVRPATERRGKGASAVDGLENELIAYEIHPVTDMPLVRAPIEREWMDQTQKRFFYRCLPLTIANQAGWVTGNPTAWVLGIANATTPAAVC